MIIQTKGSREVNLRNLGENDFDKLLTYLTGLSKETKKRFGPHDYEAQSIADFYKNTEHHGYIAESEQQEIIAYAIIKTGYVLNDVPRLQSCGINTPDNAVATFAPSVADEWQSQGIGNAMFNFMLLLLREKNIQPVILWGGVQASNQKALNYYLKNGFKIIGEFFDQNGGNYDMVLNLK